MIELEQSAVLSPPSHMARPIGIDLFSGVGGMSLGFEQAGFDVVAAVEYDSVHAAAHKFNFPHCAVLPQSITQIRGKDIRDAAGIGSRPVDVVFGGPPCQGFSMIGQRALDDPRNSLVLEFVRIVRELDARYFVFENVKGLTVGDQRRFLDEIIEEFGKNGYEVRLPWQVLNAASFGVPQDRQRLILLGARKGLEVPNYPQPFTMRADEDLPLAGLRRGPTCAEALGDLPNADQFESLQAHDCVRTRQWGKPSRYAAEMRCLDDRAWHYGYRRAWDPDVLTSTGRTVHTAISRRRFAATKNGEVEPISRFFRLPANGVSNTLRAGSDSKRGAFTSPRPIHYRYARCITVREMARLHGFPDWFRFHTTKWNGARQIGNAVPPPLARAIASKVLSAMGARPSRPKAVVKLDQPILLEMNMSAASAFWNIPIPIGRRDRKSGAKKRKQADIEASRERELMYA